jgi:hypothetical protein
MDTSIEITLNNDEYVFTIGGRNKTTTLTKNQLEAVCNFASDIKEEREAQLDVLFDSNDDNQKPVDSDDIVVPYLPGVFSTADVINLFDTTDDLLLAWYLLN